MKPNAATIIQDILDSGSEQLIIEQQEVIVYHKNGHSHIPYGGLWHSTEGSTLIDALREALKTVQAQT